jgi:hypothetical protein
LNKRKKGEKKKKGRKGRKVSGRDKRNCGKGKRRGKEQQSATAAASRVAAFEKGRKKGKGYEADNKVVDESSYPGRRACAPG